MGDERMKGFSLVLTVMLARKCQGQKIDRQQGLALSQPPRRESVTLDFGMKIDLPTQVPAIFLRRMYYVGCKMGDVRPRAFYYVHTGAISPSAISKSEMINFWAI